MRFHPTEDQQLLAGGLREMLATECTPSHVRDTWEAGHHDHDRWRMLAELGVVGLTIDEQHGGLGLDERDLVGVLVEAGRVALPEPLAEVTGVAAPLLADIGGSLAETWLPRIATGDAVVVAALPDDPYPAHVAQADLVLLATEEGVHAAEPAQLTITPQPSIDGARPVARVALAGEVPAALTGAAAERAVTLARQRAATGAAAQLAGIGEAVIALAVEYAKQREQFGRPIGSFQAVKHHLADALVDVRFALPLVERAAHSLATGDPDSGLHAAMAAAFTSEAAEAATEHSLQVHGAMGYTWECDLHLWLKRTQTLLAAWGGERQWEQVDAALV